jgi:hypothetical protein
MVPISWNDPLSQVMFQSAPFHPSPKLSNIFNCTVVAGSASVGAGVGARVAGGAGVGSAVISVKSELAEWPPDASNVSP